MNSPEQESADQAGSRPGRAVEVLVVGAGFSGVGAVIALARQGVDDVVVLERGEDVGGTWRDNYYPGAACDVPSHLYSYSFALNPDWSRAFSQQPEIQDYIRRVAREHDITRKVRFGVEVTGAHWDDERGRWTVESTGGTWDARILVLGVGALCEPKLPDIPGVADFPGPVFHSSRWDRSASLRGKRVGVIGTGASAVQIVPSIAGEVGHLDVYQRTAPWVLPRMDRRYSRLERAVYHRVPGLQRAVRGLQYTSREAQVVGLAKNQAALTPLKLIGRALLRAQVGDPALRAKLTPTFQLGCKRILLSNRYYPALTRENVDLVTAPIEKVTSEGVVTSDGVEHPTDVLVVATGFHVTDSPFFELVRRADGLSLAEVWRREGMQAYKGTTVSGFPNCFVLVGPATGLGHTSMIFMIESQLNYLADALRRMREEGISVVDVRKPVQETYNAELRRDLDGTVWVAGCHSWYLDEHGNAPAVWPRFTFTFRETTRTFDLDDYHSRKTGEPAEV